VIIRGNKFGNSLGVGKEDVDMEYKTVLVRPWKVGDMVVSTISDFSITEGKEYTIVSEGSFLDCFFIVDDNGILDDYSDCYFKMKYND
jgi:hypothetical protein